MFNRNRNRNFSGHYHPGHPSKASKDGGMLLADAPCGVPLKVSSVTCGCGIHSRLASMGILPGEIIEIVHRGNGGPIVLEVKGTRVAIGRGVGLKVIVTKGNNADEG